MGILNSAYQLLDPVLPFDKYLDPRLGKPQGGILARQAAPQGMAPPEVGAGAGASWAMGAQAMPQAPQMPQGGQQAPMASQGKPARPSLLQTIWGVAAGYDPQTVREMYSDRAASREARTRQMQAGDEQRQRMMAFADTLDPRQRAVFMADPEAWAKEAAVSYRPQVVAQGSSIYSGGAFDQAPLSPVTMPPGTVLTDANTGRTIASAPFAPQIITTGEGQIATMVQPGAPSTGGRQPRGIRNRNPGNLKDGPFARSQPGYQGADDGFAVFATPEAGIAAQERLLEGSYLGRGFNTPAAIVARYAPVGPENTPEQVANYTAYISRKTGIAPDQPIPPDRLPMVAAAMRDFENGMTGGAASGPSSTVVAQGAPKAGFVTLSPQEVQQMGLPPGSYQRSPTGEVKPVPGSQKDAMAVEKEGERNRLATAKAQRIISTIDALIPRVTRTTAGLAARIAGAIPGSSAYDLRADVETIKANLGFDEIQQMRESSPTGGALGSVAVAELNALQATIAALDTEQSPDQLKRNLEKIRTHYNNWLRTLQGETPAPARAAPPPKPVKKAAPAAATGAQPVRVRSAEEAMRLPPGTVFITPDGRRKVR
jgi:hypothetical protein